MTKVAEDQFPSTAQMDHIERMLDRDQIGMYVELLVEKLEADRFPSVPLMRRVEGMLARLG